MASYWKYGGGGLKPPPEDGIRARNFGKTWWGKRWIDALKQSSAESSRRLSRGRNYAMQGRVRALQHNGPRVTAEVIDFDAYSVQMEMTTFSNKKWRAVLQKLRSEAGFTAQLLEGTMPHEVVEVLDHAGAGLFPRGEADLRAFCTCSDWTDPCKHVAAVHYVLAEALDADPFLLFEMRGRSREAVLEDLARHRTRGQASGDVDEKPTEPEKPTLIGVEGLEGLEPADFFAGGALVEEMHFHVELVQSRLAVLRRLGSPPAVSSEALWLESLQSTYEGASQQAVALALLPSTGMNGDDSQPAEDEDEETENGEQEAREEMGDPELDAAIDEGEDEREDPEEENGDEEDEEDQGDEEDLELEDRVLDAADSELRVVEMAIELGESPVRVRQAVKTLLDEGWLIRHGRGRGTWYEVLDEPAG